MAGIAVGVFEEAREPELRDPLPDHRLQREAPVTVVALALAAALLLSVLGLAGVLRSLIRSHARERDLLINQILHLSGKTWQPPPPGEPVAQAADDFEDRFTFTPAFDE